MENKGLTAYKKAQEKVRRIKGFYKHLTAYLIVNTIIVIEGLRGIGILEMKMDDVDPAFLEWLFWNVLAVPVLWGIGLFFHGLRVFGPQMKFVKDWEENQIRKWMEKEEWSRWQ